MSIKATPTTVTVRLENTGELLDVETEAWLDTETKRLNFPSFTYSVGQPYVIVAITAGSLRLNAELHGDELVIDPADYPVAAN